LSCAGPRPVVVHCAYDTADAVRCTGEILLSRPRVSAVFVAAGDLVLGTLKACAEAGCAVPGDVSMVCFDDHPFFAHLTPPITAVAQPIAEIGCAAVQMLFELMAGREPERRAIVVPPRLVERGSCVAPHAFDTMPLVEGERIL
jgi:LacI family transcriptional regulator